MPGWSFPIGEATSVCIQDVECIVPEKGLIKWQRYTIERLRLSQAAALLVLQGLPLEQLFRGCSFSSPEIPGGLPFTFLAGRLTPPFVVIPAIDKVTLGYAREFPHSLTWEEVLAAMLRDTLLP